MADDGEGLTASVVLGALDDAVIAADFDGKIVYANAGVERILGWRPDDLVGRTLETIIPATMRPLHRAGFDRFVRSGTGRIVGHPVQMYALARDGREIRIELTLSSLWEEAGRGHVVGSVRDLGERYEEAEARFRVLVESTDAVFWEADPGGTYSFVSRQALNLFGYPPDSWLGDAKFWSTVIVHPDDRERALADRLAAVEHRRDGLVEYRARTSSGATRWVRDQHRLLVDEQGRPRSLRGVMVDVTAEKEAVRRREAQFAATRALSVARSLREASGEVLTALCEHLDWDFAALWILLENEDALTCVEVHEHAGPLPHFRAETEGLKLQQGEGVPGRAWLLREPIWIPNYVEEEYPRKQAALADGVNTLYCLPLAVAGRIIGVLEFASKQVREPDADIVSVMTGVAAQVGHLVERRRAEERLRVQNALLQSQSNATLDAILVLSLDGRPLFLNERLMTLTGLQPEAFEGSSAGDLTTWLQTWVADPTDIQGVMDAMQASPEGEVRREIELADGRVLDVYSAPLVVGDEHLGRAWYLRDISERRAAEHSLRELAKTLQSSLLPPMLPHAPGLDAGARYEAATAGGMYVGGDFYDFFDTGDGWVAVMGDVCGKGAEAAAVTGLVRYSIRSAAVQSDDPAAVLAIVNDAVLQYGVDERFCTVAYVRVRPTERGAHVDVACAGHPLPLVMRRSGNIESLGGPGMPIGLFPGAPSGLGSTELLRGEAIVLYTDGVIEARRDDGELFGSSRLRAVLTMKPEATADEVAGAIEREVTNFQDGLLRDDMAVLVVRVPE